MLLATDQDPTFGGWGGPLRRARVRSGECEDEMHCLVRFLRRCSHHADLRGWQSGPLGTPEEGTTRWETRWVELAGAQW